MANDEFPTPREPVIEHVEMDPMESADSPSSNPPPPTSSTDGTSRPTTNAPEESGSMSRGKLAAVGGGLAAIGLVLGLLIGWFAFDDGGSNRGRGNDKGRMSQQQGPGGGHQDGGGMRRGKMGSGTPDGMVPGGGRQVAPENPVPNAPPSTDKQAVPQNLQQG